MKIVQLTPGSGDSFYCENCLRDNDLVKAERALGHDVLMIPLYLPILGDEETCDEDMPIFFGGINVYLQQKSALFRKAPRWVDRIFNWRPLLRFAARKAAMTRAAELGATTISMLKGEEGRQAKELDKLIDWLKTEERVDLVFLSNALLAGLARRIRETLAVPVVCELQGEHTFLDALAEPDRTTAWEVLRERVRDIDGFIAASRFYRDYMAERLRLDPERVKVVYNGVPVREFTPASSLPDPPVISYLARMCRGGGLDVLTEAFIKIRRRGRAGPVRLRAAGGKTADDDDFLEGVRARLKAEGLLEECEFLPNLGHREKIEFLRRSTVLSVPSTLGEAFGRFVLEALASGVPVVLPRDGAFTELVEATEGGILCEPGDPESLAEALEKFLCDSEARKEAALRGRRAVEEKFSVEVAARRTVEVFRETVSRFSAEKG